MGYNFKEGKTIKLIVGENTITPEVDEDLIPTKMSQLNNDSFFVEDKDYVHTDNNYTKEEKEKLKNIPSEGIKGDKGDTGEQGPQGPQGPQGEKGADGKDGAVNSESLSNMSCDTLIGRNIIGYGNNMTNRPNPTDVSISNGYFWNIAHDLMPTTYNVQFYKERDVSARISGLNTGRLYTRSMENGVWNEWIQIPFVFGNNVVLGIGAAINNTGTYDTAIGHNAMRNATAPANTVAVGSNALYSAASTGSVIGIGNDALYGLQRGNYTIALGRNAGRYLADGTTLMTIAPNSLFLGALTKANADNETNQIVIGHNAIGNGSNTITLGDSNITKIHAQVTALTALSDKRVKENIEEANLDLCYEAVKNLPVHRFKYKEFTGTHIDTNVTGWLADEVEKVFPKSVSKSDKWFSVLDENGEQVYEEVEQIEHIPNTEAYKALELLFLENKIDEAEYEKRLSEIEDIETKVIVTIPKMFLMEDVKDITMTEAIPTLWGAVQKLMREVEELKEFKKKVENDK